MGKPLYENGAASAISKLCGNRSTEDGEGEAVGTDTPSPPCGPDGGHAKFSAYLNYRAGQIPVTCG